MAYHSVWEYEEVQPMAVPMILARKGPWSYQRSISLVRQTVWSVYCELALRLVVGRRISLSLDNNMSDASCQLSQTSTRAQDIICQSLRQLLSNAVLHSFE